MAGTLAWSSAAQAATWTVDAPHSRLGFTGSQSGSAFAGRFTRWTAEIDFDPAQPARGHALVTIDMASATTGDLQKDEALPGATGSTSHPFPRPASRPPASGPAAATPTRRWAA